MSKRNRTAKKKRNKKYTGEDAAIQGTRITRVKAVKKSAIQEYWANHGKQIKAMVIIGAVLFVVGYGVFGLVSWIL